MPIIFTMIMVLAGLLLWTPDLSFERLKAFYETPQSQLIQTPESLIFAEDSNPAATDKATLVLIHGFGSSLQTWDEWTRLLKPHLRIVRFDLPGFGLSTAPTSNDYSDGADMRRLEQLIDAKKLDSFMIAGHSIGGRMAWMYAAKHPEKVTHLVLLSPDGFPSEPEKAFSQGADFKPAHTYDTPFYLGLMRYALPKWAVKMALESAFADPGLMTEQTLSRYHDMLLAPGVRASMLERMQQTMSIDPRSSLRSIHMPTLILWGDQDSMIPVSNLADYQREMPTAQWSVLKDTGHLIQEESGEESAKTFLSFIGKLQSSDPGSKFGNSTSTKPN
jgi:pimeloyl-ACP methyl ester carboxylesterase